MQKDHLECEFCGNCRNLRREIPDSQWLEEMGEMIAAAVETMERTRPPQGCWEAGWTTRKSLPTSLFDPSIDANASTRSEA